MGVWLEHVSVCISGNGKCCVGAGCENCTRYSMSGVFGGMPMAVINCWGDLGGE